MTLTSPNRGHLLERIDGNSGSMSYWNGLFTRIADRLDALRTAATAVSDLAGVGKAVTAARANAGTLAGAIGPDVAEAELLAGILQRYADAVDEHAKKANDLIDDVETAHRTLEDARTQLTDMRSSQTMAKNEDMDASLLAMADVWVSSAEGDVTNAETALADLWLQWETAYGLWDDAYDRALSELSGGSESGLSPESKDLLDDLLAADSPEKVLELWNLPESKRLRDELIKNHPDIIGNLDGIPYDVRADANRSRLDALYDADLDEPLRSQIDALWRAMGQGAPPPNLISFDPTGSEQVTAALAYGDLADADNINLLVPGMNSNVNGIGEWGQSAKDLNEGVGGKSATIVWFGYDSPNEMEEPAMGRAEDGAVALRSFLLGIDVLSPDAQTTVVAHSYGSTTAALAIGSEPGGLGVDKLIVVGSAGLSSDSKILENLQTGPQLYATLSEGDMWARIGRDTSWLGAHSTAPETLPGVIEFGSDGGVAADNTSLAPTPGHGAHTGANGLKWIDEGKSDGYLMDGTESFYNIEQIIKTGEPGTVMDGDGSTNGFWDFPDWLPFNPYRF